MANKKITQLTELNAAIAATDLLVLVDDPAGSPVTKKMEWGNLLSNLPTASGAITLAAAVNTNIVLSPGDTTGAVQISGATNRLRFSESDTTNENWQILHSAGDFRLQQANDDFSSVVDVLYVQQDGDIGIAISPTATFHTYQSDTDTISWLCEQDSTGDASLSFLLSSTKQYTIGIDNSSTNDDFVICNDSDLANNQRLVISGSTGNIGIGASPGTAKLYSYNSQSNSAAYAAQNEARVITSSTGSHTGIAQYLITDNSYVSSGQSNSSYTAGQLIDAHINTASHQGTLATQYGTTLNYGISSCGAGGTITTAYGHNITLQNQDADGTITTAYGLYIGASGSSGTVTNRWGIYVADGDADNYFDGNVGIGTAPSGFKLRVSDNSTSTSPLLYLEQGGTGDAALRFTAGSDWVLGVDNSDSDAFKIGTGTTISTDEAVHIETSGDVGIGATPSDDFHVIRASGNCHMRLTGATLRIRFDEDDTSNTNGQYLFSSGALRYQTSNNAFSSVVDQFRITTAGAQCDNYLRLYNRTDANRGAAGISGRIIFNTDDGTINVDDGTNWTDAAGTVT